MSPPCHTLHPIPLTLIHTPLHVSTPAITAGLTHNVSPLHTLTHTAATAALTQPHLLPCQCCHRIRQLRGGQATRLQASSSITCMHACTCVRDVQRCSDMDWIGLDWICSDMRIQAGWQYHGEEACLHAAVPIAKLCPSWSSHVSLCNMLRHTAFT